MPFLFSFCLSGNVKPETVAIGIPVWDFYVYFEQIFLSGFEVVKVFEFVVRSHRICQNAFGVDRFFLDDVAVFIRSRAWADEYELIYSSDHLLEMTVHGATKGGMVLRLADLLGVAQKDLYCAGDHLNDIPMLDVAAIGFAPANSVPDVLSCGAQIVCHCKDGAIADIIDILDKRY